MIERSLSGFTVIVPTYDEGLACFRDKMGFAVIDDVDLGGRQAVADRGPVQ